MTKSILVALCGALTLSVASGCANDLREDTNETGRSNLESEGESEAVEGEVGEEGADEEASREEGADEEAAREDGPREDSAGAEDGTAASADPFYYGYLCSEELVLFGTYTSPEDARNTCSSTDLGNPQLGGLLCTLGGEVIYDSCSGRVGSPDGEPEGEVPDASGEPSALLGAYAAAFCEDGFVFIQSADITREEALENCLLNEASNPDRSGVVCRFNDEILYDSCPEVAVAPGPEACEGWEATTLDRAQEFIDTTYWSADEMNCDGASFRRFDARYGLWVGLVSCGSGYRFYLSETAEGPYLPAADGGGHGQDLCELVDPSFSIPNEDDITSGGCAECATSRNYSFIAGEVFGRSAFGQPFTRAEAPEWGNYQSSVITCATGPVECGTAVQ
jgi:hypothetical protein